jgi:hypothetical protein
MPKKLLLPLLLAFSLFAGFTPRITTFVKQVEYVYLCEGPYSKVYHKSQDCRGLSNCSTKIYKVTLEEAVKMGRRPCKIEYK